MANDESLKWGQLQPGTMVISYSRWSKDAHTELVIDGTVRIWSPRQCFARLDPEAPVCGVEVQERFVIWKPDGRTIAYPRSEWVP